MASRQLILGSSTISVDGNSVGATYNIEFGNPALYMNEVIDFFTISGTATLSSSLTITSTYTPVGSVKVVFLSRAAITLGSNTLTIFGYNVTATQALNPFTVIAWWDGSTWQAVLSRVEIPAGGVPNSSLENMAAYTVKMNSGGTTLPPQDVTFANVRGALNLEYDLINCVVDLNSGFLHPTTCRQDILIPYKGEVTRVFGYITQDINSTDDATIDFGIAGSAGGGYSSFSQMTLTAGANADTFVNDSSPDTPVNQFNANNFLVVDTQKNTWGGRAIFTIVTKRT